MEPNTESVVTAMAFATFAVQFGLLCTVIVIAALWRVFRKAGQPAWAVFVPFYNAYVLTRIAGKPGWWLLLYFVPLVDVIIAVLVVVALAKNFGKTTGFGLGLLLLPMIFFPILADGGATYLPGGTTILADPSTVRQRESLLTALLVLFFVGGVGSILAPLTARGMSGSSSLFSVRLPLFGATILGGLWGVWHWRRWGAYFLIGGELMALGAGLSSAKPGPLFTTTSLVLQLVYGIVMLGLAGWSLKRAWPQLQ